MRMRSNAPGENPDLFVTYDQETMHAPEEAPAMVAANVVVNYVFLIK